MNSAILRNMIGKDKESSSAEAKVIMKCLGFHGFVYCKILGNVL